jgi:hypothetical protein
MATGLKVTRQNAGEDHIIFTRLSDGEVFHLWLHEDSQASLCHNDKVPPNGIGADACIPDKIAWAVKLILDYPTGWS